MKKSEFHNYCPGCLRKNTLWPYWMGRKRAYKCEKCGIFVGTGLTKAKALKRRKELRARRKNGNK